MSYVRFYSGLSFKLSTYNNTKYWDGTLQYSYDGSTWNTWDGTTVLNSGNSLYYSIYLRGINNTYCGDSYSNPTFCFTEFSVPIDSEGNIESLLDYATVDNNQHPIMAYQAFIGLFMDQIALRTAPELGAITLSEQCYRDMFSGCTALTVAPELPALELATLCYAGMFYECTGLTTPPFLPATKLAPYCYQSMFGFCTSLTAIPSLLATNLIEYCYYNMFQQSNVKISTTSSDIFTTEYRIPKIGTGTTASNCTYRMFYSSGSVATPDINTTYYVNVEILDTQYKSNQIELGLVAQAIRDKAEISSSLTFPEDYITEINNIVVDIDNAYLISQAVPSDALGSDGDICIVYN